MHVAEVRRGYMPFSKNRLRADKRVQVGGPRKSLAPGAATSKVVRSLDPDAESRGEGKWDLEDANYAKALHRTLFEYARSGQLAAAFDLARQADQPWRAASLRGAMFYHRSINGLRQDDEEEDDDDIMMNGGGTSGGNRNRLLWKAVCGKLAGNPSLDPFERALYGSLAGHLSSVLAVSDTWEEHLWAYINASLETRLDASFEHASSDEASWWGSTGGGTVKVVELKSATSIVQDDKLDVREDLKDVFDKLKNTDRGNVHLEAANPYHIVQEAIIMDGVSDLLIHVESRLSEMKVSIEPRKYAHLVRFFSHLILYMRLLERPLPSATCNSILRHYVEVLELAGEDELVAMYASCLEPQSAEESYAHFLKSLNLDMPTADRRSALLRAQEHALDLAAVARLVVQSVFTETVDALESRQSWMVDPISALSQELSVPEARLIWAVDWLTFDPSTAADAIFQSNALMRKFLSRGRIHAARTLLYNLPGEVVGNLEEIAELKSSDRREHLDYRLFFEAFATLSSYAEVFSKDPSASGAASRMETQQWKRALSSVVSTAKGATLEILTRDWLKPGEEDEDGEEDDDDEDPTRARELAQIRQIYIPELVFRLHFMLFDSREVVADAQASLEYITKDLPILVASEDHMLFLEFVTAAGGNRLREYLEHVRVACVESL